MFKFRKSLIALVVLLALIGVIAALTPRPITAQNAVGPTKPVLVVNSASEPVPVTGTVNVGNLGGSPLPVRDVDNPARQPFSKCVSDVEQNGTRSTFKPILTVPAGKRLVVEDAGAALSLPPGQRGTAALEKLDPSNAVIGDRLLTLTFQYQETINIPATDFLEAGESVRMYFEPGETLGATVVRSSSTGVAVVGVCISSYFVDVP